MDTYQVTMNSDNFQIPIAEWRKAIVKLTQHSQETPIFSATPTLIADCENKLIHELQETEEADIAKNYVSGIEMVKNAGVDSMDETASLICLLQSWALISHDLEKTLLLAEQFLITRFLITINKKIGPSILKVIDELIEDNIHGATYFKNQLKIEHGCSEETYISTPKEERTHPKQDDTHLQSPDTMTRGEVRKMVWELKIEKDTASALFSNKDPQERICRLWDLQRELESVKTKTNEIEVIKWIDEQLKTNRRQQLKMIYQHNLQCNETEAELYSNGNSHIIGNLIEEIKQVNKIRKSFQFNNETGLKRNRNNFEGSSPRTFTPMAERKCYNCGELGHIRRFCKKRANTRGGAPGTA